MPLDSILLGVALCSQLLHVRRGSKPPAHCSARLVLVHVQAAPSMQLFLGLALAMWS